MVGIIIYLFILLIFYGSIYVLLDWNGETITAYLQLNGIFKQTPSILIESRGGGCIWKNIVREPYIKQFCLKDDVESACMHMSIAVKLFAGYGDINITKKAYSKRMIELLAMPGVSYDPYSRCLYINGNFEEHQKSVNERIIAMFDLASEAAQKTEAFASAGTSSRDNLRYYYRKYFHPVA